MNNIENSPGKGQHLPQAPRGSVRALTLKYREAAARFIGKFTKKQLLWAGISSAIVLVLAATAILLWFFRNPPLEYIPPPEETASLPAPADDPVAIPDPEPEPGPEIIPRSPLSGRPVSPEDLSLRPIAVVINNFSSSLPQSGIAGADLIYEVLAEGDITRMVVFFQKPEAAKIGSVRSVRDYFVDFALDYDAILVHHGGSETGYARIKAQHIDDLDGMQLEGSAFWRDPVRVSQKGMYEHSSYTNAERIEAAIAKYSYRREQNEGDHYGFAFYTEEGLFEDAVRESGADYRPCPEITVPFSRNYTRRFIYDPDEKRYDVFNRSGPHVDEELGNGPEAQLHAANILVQYVHMRVIPGDQAGHREVTTTGAGEGLFFTEGGCVPITWERESLTTPTSWFLTEGRPLELNPGLTWICVLQSSVKVQTGDDAT